MRRSLVPVVLLPIALLAAIDVAFSDRAAANGAVVFNDNRARAGTVRNGVLRVELETRRSQWHVLGDQHPAVEILAFAERGKAAMIPAPLVRVRRGTIVEVTVHNTLDTLLVVHGFTARRLPTLDSLIVPPRESRRVRFTADEAGTYYYWGTTTGAALDDRAFEDSQLSGALIVDADEKIAKPDRILILGSYFDGKEPNGEPDGAREFLVINGRPWPFTERMEYQLGDSIRWRIINASLKVHPMHLHGFYFRVDAQGDFAQDTVYWPAKRRTAVTERMDPGSTLSLVWAPDRPGAWLFHCHLNFHVIPNPLPGASALSEERRFREVFIGDFGHGAHDHVQQGMGGLMLLTRVVARGVAPAEESARRKMRIFVHSDSLAGDSLPRFAFVLQDGDVEPAPDSVRRPGSMLLLQRGEPTSIQVINRSAEPTQIHWHGIELENYYDGAVGLGEHAGMRTPAVMPGDSFEVRLTPPRSGSFMYHTHVNDIRQQSLGLFGSLLVVDDRARWDASRDLVYIAGEGGFGPTRLFPPSAEPMALTVGATYRMRLMNVTLTGPALQYILTANGAPVRWTPIAKDGHDLPAMMRRQERSARSVTIGETLDVEVTPAFPGEYWLELRTGGGRLVGRHLLRVTAGGSAG